MFEGFSAQLPDIIARLQESGNQNWSDEEQAIYQAQCIIPCHQLIEAMQKAPSYDGRSFACEFDFEYCLLGMQQNDENGEKNERNYLHLKFEANIKAENRPAIHLIFSAGGFGVGAGIARFNPNQMGNYLKAIENKRSIERLKLAINDAQTAGCFLEVSNKNGMNKRGVVNDGPQNFKQLSGIIVRNRNEDYPDGFFDDRCINVINNRIKPLLSLQNWLIGNIYA